MTDTQIFAVMLSGSLLAALNVTEAPFKLTMKLLTFLAGVAMIVIAAYYLATQ